MKSTLIVAAVAIALVGSSPLPAFAAKNTGSHIDSAEFNRNDRTCQSSWVDYDHMMTKLREAKTSQDKKTARDGVNTAINMGYAAGCAWVGAV